MVKPIIKGFIVRKFFTLVLVFFSSFAYSMDIHLADVISEPEDNRVHKFFVEVNENLVTSNPGKITLMHSSVT